MSSLLNQYESAKENMVKRQLQTVDVLDDDLLNDFNDIPRERFIPKNFQALSYADTELPIGHGEFSFNPQLEAKFIQAMDIKDTMNILEIGTGCGYFSALLARRCDSVTSLDIHQDLLDSAKEKLNEQNIDNIELFRANGLSDWNPDRKDYTGPYDLIFCGGSILHIPEHFINLLNKDGTCWGVVGDIPIMRFCCFVKKDDSLYQYQSKFETMLPPLITDQIRSTSFSLQG